MHIGTFVFCTDSTVSPSEVSIVVNMIIVNNHIYNKKILCISNFVCIFATP